MKIKREKDNEPVGEMDLCGKSSGLKSNHVEGTQTDNINNRNFLKKEAVENIDNKINKSAE